MVTQTDTENLERLREIASLPASFDELFESSAEAMLIVRAGIIIGCNKNAEIMFGYRREEMLGQPLGMIMPGEADETEALRSPRLSHVDANQPRVAVRTRCKRGLDVETEMRLGIVPIDDDMVAIATLRELPSAHEPS